MTELLPNLQFAKPAFLWLLLVLPLLWFRFRDQRIAVILWRTVILLLLVLSLADPQSVAEQTRHEERIFAFDVSRSIPPSMHSWMLNTMTEDRSPRRQDRTYVFGSETREVTNWREWVGGEKSRQDVIRPDGTNLENLLSTVLALPAGSRRLFLFTDGWETQGNVEHLLPSIAGSGLTIYPILPVERPKIANVAVTKLLAPSHGDSGEALNLRVLVENQGDREVDGTITLSRNGKSFKSEAVKLKPGSQIFTYSATLSEGSVAYRASFTPRRPASDQYPADNQALALITAKTKAKVLLLNGQRGGGRYLEEILKRIGFDVNSRNADSPPAPTGYNIVIFNNVEREKFSSSYLAAVERHVAEGNAFLMLGNDASFAPGSYRRTPIESLLPVEPREPKHEEKNRAVVLVIDKSGSMREDNRILFAREAAKAVARQLKDKDLLAVVGFDISPFTVVPLEPVGKLRSTVDGQIDRLRPGGRTYLLPAIIEAKRQLERSAASRKHVIILSDGETGGSGGDYIDLVNAMRSELKITVSTVAVGTEANIPLMKRIAQYGGGFFHHTYDPSTLPQIVLQQIQDKPKEEPPAEKSFTPVQERGSELLAGFQGRSYPAVRDYMETDLKQGARLDLMIPRPEHRVPLLASWRYGKGKSVALTMDLEGRGSRNWIQWSQLQTFWTKVFDWLRPPEEPVPVHEARVSLTENSPVLDLYLYDEAMAEDQYRFAVTGKGAKSEGNLKRISAGHYQARLPLSAPGDYRIELTEERHGRKLPLPPIGYSLPYAFHSEIQRPELNTELLARLAQTSGGEINPAAQEVVEKSEVKKIYTPNRASLIIFAFSLFLLEVALRKIVFSEPD